MGTVSKALSLLSYFTLDRDSIGLSELARLSGLNKATVYRLMGELQVAGFVEQIDEQRGYRLGSELLRLAALREAAVPMVEIGRKLLGDLSDATGETTHMSLVRDDQLVALAHAHSNRHATRVIMSPAEDLSFHGTSSGLAILAFSDFEFVDRILTQPLVAHTDKTLTDAAQIRDRLYDIRQKGFASYEGGIEPEVFSHAAPFFDAHGRVIGAMSVAAPVNRVDDAVSKDTSSRVISAARQLTEESGGIWPIGTGPND